MHRKIPPLPSTTLTRKASQSATGGKRKAQLIEVPPAVHAVCGLIAPLVHWGGKAVSSGASIQIAHRPQTRHLAALQHIR
jgi:hypothetical protein